MGWMNNMKKVDENHDRVISQRELYLYLEKDVQKMSNNDNTEGYQKDSVDVIYNLFMNKDIDEDGYITFEEFKDEHNEL